MRTYPRFDYVLEQPTDYSRMVDSWADLFLKYQPDTKNAKAPEPDYDEIMRCCPCCGRAMVERGCKISCPQCGFFLDCSSLPY